MGTMQRTCTDCGKSFVGGPRAWRCEKCREIASRKTNAEHKARKRLGLTRKIGSLDTCKICGKQYEVKSGLQEYCPPCAEIYRHEYDAARKLEYYRENRDEINPPRNDRRRKPPTLCAVCGQEFKRADRSKFCSQECKRTAINNEWNIRRRAGHFPSHPTKNNKENHNV